MKRITLAILTAIGFAACAQAAPMITLLPAGGALAGAPGTVVGWGFSLTNTDPADWVVLTGSEFIASPVYGTYYDYLSLGNAPLYVAGPAPESSTVTQAWAASPIGLGEFDINATALPGANITGNIVVHYDVFSQDPNSPSFDPGSLVISGATLSAPAEVTVTPEPSSIMLAAGAAFLAFGFGVRRRSIARQP